MMPKNKVIINGTINRNVTVKNSNATLKINQKNRGKIEITSSGLVVSFNGGGDIIKTTKDYKDSFYLAKKIVENGGIVVNGGRNVGIMQAVTEAGGKYSLGVNFIEQINAGKTDNNSKKIVTEPATRILILTSCLPIVVVYKGGLGTFHELINGMITVKNKKIFKLFAPKLYFHDFWKKIILDLGKEGIIKKEYISSLTFFKSNKIAETIIQTSLDKSLRN